MPYIASTRASTGLFQARCRAVRDYKGCEVAAISNTLLRRHGEIGCFFFAPADALDSRLTRKPREEC